MEGPPLVIITSPEVLGVFLFDFLVGEAIAHPGVEFVECFPLLLFVGKVLSGLNCAAERGGPERHFGVADGLLDEVGETAGVGVSALGEACITADLAGDVELGFTVLHGVSRLLHQRRNLNPLLIARWTAG